MKAVLILETEAFALPGTPHEVRICETRASEVLRTLVDHQITDYKLAAQAWSELDKGYSRFLKDEGERMRRFLEGMLPAEVLPEDLSRGG